MREPIAGLIQKSGPDHGDDHFVAADPARAEVHFLIRETDMIGDEVPFDLTVSTWFPIMKFRAWLESRGRDPSEAAMKSKLR